MDPLQGSDNNTSMVEHSLRMYFVSQLLKV